MDPETPRSIDVSGLVATGSAWSQVTVAGGLVFVSGQIAWNEKGELIGGHSVEEQAEYVFGNLERALEGAGSGLEKLARISAYLTDSDHVAAFRSVRDGWLEGIRPASTIVIVSALVDPGLLVEVDAVATS